jgi:hypothetical protein
MTLHLENWNPMFNLKRATNEERIVWRRAYTINWLYGLVNVFSSGIILKTSRKDKRLVYKDIDWSKTGPWKKHRQLFGLTDFASDITTLAMQEPNAELLRKISPHQVFQLQCVVDSFTASRGWTLCPRIGDVLAAPPRGFRSRRDVDLFLSREIHQGDRGVFQYFDHLRGLLQADANLHEDSDRHTSHSELLKRTKSRFDSWLGMSKGTRDLTVMPFSRFSKQDANELWEYSPLLCAVGLVEGLVLVQRLMMRLWDHIHEPTLLLHLHNNLVKKGYLDEKESRLYPVLEPFLQDAFFPTGVPTEGFFEALTTRLDQGRTDRLSLYRVQQAFLKSKTEDLHQILDLGLNRFFNIKSTLMMYYDAGWITEQIPDNEIQIPSVLYLLRLLHTERVINPTTNKKSLKETELVKRAKALGKSDDDLLEEGLQHIIEEIERMVAETEDHQRRPKRDPYQVSKDKNPVEIKGSAILKLLRKDVYHDVYGLIPISSLNLIAVTCHMLAVFQKIESRLRKTRHPLWIDSYERPDPRVKHQRRVAMVRAAMRDQDDAVMKLLAEAFEQIKVDPRTYVFWEDLSEFDIGEKADRHFKCPCSVM